MFNSITAYREVNYDTKEAIKERKSFNLLEKVNRITLEL